MRDLFISRKARALRRRVLLPLLPAVALLLASTTAFAQSTSTGTTPAPSPTTQQAVTPAPPPSPETAASPASSLPPESRWTYAYPTGRWVYTTEHGWIWVPEGATPVVVDAVPYVYLYTPTYGWNWYVSPWGPGPYLYGAWVVRPWRPLVWPGVWVARPHVVVRLAPHRHVWWHHHR